MNPTCIESSVLQYLQKVIVVCSLAKTSVEYVLSSKEHNHCEQIVLQ